ncbi:hypothetical protein PR202_gb13057 [Eleusine coracana subsp. coracana]|uniref:Uncharacterized protein n=1 Tax=Eleusine coracana subsp. coracana TaxID=191504 RepID=A0AAV5ESQ9_ELECO|nr:hypothetical protein PR202_gb13057 [Eleusine coracana subsp. coracana]
MEKQGKQSYREMRMDSPRRFEEENEVQVAREKKDDGDGGSARGLQAMVTTATDNGSVPADLQRKEVAIKAWCKVTLPRRTNGDRKGKRLTGDGKIGGENSVAARAAPPNSSSPLHKTRRDQHRRVCESKQKRSKTAQLTGGVHMACFLRTGEKGRRGGG